MGFSTTQIQAAAGETEQSFVQRVIDMIVGIDSRITCNTTAAAQYADTSATATFDYDIDGKYIFRMTRGAVNSSQAGGYYFSIIVDGVEYTSSAYVRMWTKNSTASTDVQNGYDRISAYATDNDLFLWFGAYYNQEVEIIPSHYISGFVTDGDNEAYCYGNKNSNDIQDQSFYKIDGTTGYSLPKLLSYTDVPGMISIVKNGNPIKNSGGFVSFAKDLIPSSTRTVGDSVVFDGKTYFAVGTNLLVKEGAA